jgi:hypothetical protein
MSRRLIGSSLVKRMEPTGAATKASLHRAIVTAYTRLGIDGDSAGRSVTAMGAVAHLPSDLLPGRPGQVVRWIGNRIYGSTPRIRFPPAWGLPLYSVPLFFFHFKKTEET